jgi:hypothetical protein
VRVQQNSFRKFPVRCFSRKQIQDAAGKKIFTGQGSIDERRRGVQKPSKITCDPDFTREPIRDLL